jgi:hypothetical protein
MFREAADSTPREPFLCKKTAMEITMTVSFTEYTDMGKNLRILP